jgi:hypothetical protein
MASREGAPRDAAPPSDEKVWADVAAVAANTRFPDDLLVSAYLGDLRALLAETERLHGIWERTDRLLQAQLMETERLRGALREIEALPSAVAENDAERFWRMHSVAARALRASEEGR